LKGPEEALINLERQVVSRPLVVPRHENLPLHSGKPAEGGRLGVTPKQPRLLGHRVVEGSVEGL
jgi:hypothetical protein